ncbi:FUSC family protein [Bradyrhizobium daqingense]|nr:MULTISPECIES: FUSC family protein [Bradyrhizobium]MDQ8731683.1 FUSC family protein [Bradyrhizobium sp. LHD-71]UFS92749.1 FUSC family protein [Bradyrhizobium daqingense]
MPIELYVSFWLELESPSSAALTVAVLALPTRGQGMEKAGYRLVATAIGVAASIAIAGVFSQTGGLLLASHRRSRARSWSCGWPTTSSSTRATSSTSSIPSTSTSPSASTRR